MSVLGTVAIGHAHALFTGTRTQPNPPQLEGPSRLHPLLAITALRGLQRLDSATALLGLSGCVMHGSIAYDGAGILTCFPFGVLQLGYALGPANPRLTNIAVEPWPLRRSGFSPDSAATFARILVGAWSTGAHAPASAHAPRPPTYSLPHGESTRVSVAGLSPVHFRGPHPRPVSCYALFKGWLLLSLPPGCLRVWTPFGSHLAGT